MIVFFTAKHEKIMCFIIGLEINFKCFLYLVNFGSLYKITVDKVIFASKKI